VSKSLWNPAAAKPGNELGLQVFKKEFSTVFKAAAALGLQVVGSST
jgi:hypothetical protein